MTARAYLPANNGARGGAGYAAGGEGGHAPSLMPGKYLGKSVQTLQPKQKVTSELACFVSNHDHGCNIGSEHSNPTKGLDLG